MMHPIFSKRHPIFSYVAGKVICIILIGIKSKSDYLKISMTKFTFGNENISKVKLKDNYSA